MRIEKRVVRGHTNRLGVRWIIIDDQGRDRASCVTRKAAQRLIDADEVPKHRDDLTPDERVERALRRLSRAVSPTTGDRG